MRRVNKMAHTKKSKRQIDWEISYLPKMCRTAVTFHCPDCAGHVDHMSTTYVFLCDMHKYMARVIQKELRYCPMCGTEFVWDDYKENETNG